jgi:hypothetical protein
MEPATVTWKEQSSLPVQVELTDSRGGKQTIDLHAESAPGFIETRRGEHFRIQMTWPHGDTEVWATRMDGGVLEGSPGTLLKIPVNAQGAIDFGFRIGSEPGRYQLEIAGKSGAVEHLAFWADPPNLPVESSGTTFVEPPLRTHRNAKF